MKFTNLIKSKNVLIFFIIFLFLLLPIFYANAIDWPQSASEGLETITNAGGLPRENAGEFVGRVIKYVLGVIGIILMTLLIFGGFKYMTSGGNEESIEKSKKLLKAAIVGLLIVAAAYIVASYILMTVFFS